MSDFIEGRLEPFFETGTEGVIWSLINPIIPSYDGLFPIAQNDDLIICDDDGNILWEGQVNLEYQRNFMPYPMNPTRGQQTVLGYWVHGLQCDVDPDTWGRWFFDHRRAKLRFHDQTSYAASRPQHLFTQSAADILRASLKPCFGLSPDDYQATYRAAHYRWINWYSERNEDDSWHVTGHGGSHTKLHFSPDEAIQIIGSPDAETVETWINHENPEPDRAIFYHLALVNGIMGYLEIQFHTDEKIGEWIANQKLDGKPMRDCFFTTRGLRKIHDCVRALIRT